MELSIGLIGRAQSESLNIEPTNASVHLMHLSLTTVSALVDTVVTPRRMATLPPGTCLQITHFGGSMNNNRIEGTAKQVKGSVKEAIGKVTGDKATQLEGAAEKVEGKVQANIGKATDAVKDRLKK